MLKLSIYIYIEIISISKYVDVSIIGMNYEAKYLSVKVYFLKKKQEYFLASNE